jgi:hypothetical protein
MRKVTTRGFLATCSSRLREGVMTAESDQTVDVLFMEKRNDADS